ncbi:MAG: DNA polymerase III subunit beta [Elusimicrobiaceae bacterium]|nr:DNA polymerase III subunit beta [Elusimicrobiaceae bacterium]
MRINSTKENLLEGIQIIQASGAARTTLPILHNFLMETDEGKIKLVRTDLEMATTHYINAEVVEPGSITIPAKEFSDILHTLSGDTEITVYTDETKVHIECGKSKFWVMGTLKEEYPLVPEMENSNMVQMPAETVRQMIQKTIFAASNQETRYVLNGLLWVVGPDGFEMVATDGRRLAISLNKDIKAGKELKIIVPTKILNEIVRFLGINEPEKDEKIEVGISENQIGFRMRNTTYISRLIEGNFPNYKQVIPASTDKKMVVSVKELMAVTKRAALCAADRGGSVRYEIRPGSVLVKASSQKMEFSDEITAEFDGGEFITSFNPQYVTDVLKNTKADKIEFGMTNSINPALLIPEGEEDSRYVIMPVRV